MPSKTETSLNGVNRWKHPHHAANEHAKDKKPTTTGALSRSLDNTLEDKAKLDKDVADVGTALAQAFNDVWNKGSGPSGVSIEEFWKEVRHLQLQLNVSNENISARCSNASILDRTKTELTPLTRIAPNNLGIEDTTRILELGVTIAYLEGFPDAYKAAMLYLIGINPYLINWVPPSGLKGGNKEEAFSYLAKLVQETVEYPEDRDARIQNDGNHDWKAELLEVPDNEARSPQLTRQLRVAVGLPAVQVAAVNVVP